MLWSDGEMLNREIEMNNVFEYDVMTKPYFVHEVNWKSKQAAAILKEVYQRVVQYCEAQKAKDYGCYMEEFIYHYTKETGQPSHLIEDALLYLDKLHVIEIEAHLVGQQTIVTFI